MPAMQRVAVSLGEIIVEIRGGAQLRFVDEVVAALLAPLHLIAIDGAAARAVLHRITPFRS